MWQSSVHGVMSATLYSRHPVVRMWVIDVQRRGDGGMMRRRDTLRRMVVDGFALSRVVVGQAGYRSCGESRVCEGEGRAEWAGGMEKCQPDGSVTSCASSGAME